MDKEKKENLEDGQRKEKTQYKYILKETKDGLV